MILSAAFFNVLADDDSSSASVFVWTAALLILVLVFFFAVVIVRKRLSPDEDFHGEGFTLGDLRAMRKNGQLSEEEFERARAKIVETLHATQARKDAAKAEAAKHKMS